MSFPERKVIESPDAWYFHDGKKEKTHIKVLMHLGKMPIKMKNPFKVYVYGENMFGYYMWFVSDSRIPCRKVFDKIKDGIAMKDLKRMGFKEVK